MRLFDMIFDPTLREVEEIKVQIYNETKDMTREEARAYIRKDVLKAAEKYGFTLKSTNEIKEAGAAAGRG